MLIPQQVKITINPSRVPGAADITVHPLYECSTAELIEYLSMAAQALYATMGGDDNGRQ